MPPKDHPRANFLAAAGLASRSTTPLLFSTEIAATFVGDGETADPADGTAIDSLDFTTATGNETARKETARKQFKLLLSGIINIRTDGQKWRRPRESTLRRNAHEITSPFVMAI